MGKYLSHATFLSLSILFICTARGLAADLVIPVMVGQTGGSAQFGKGELDAYTLASEEWNAKGGVNGRRVVLTVEDTQTNQQQIVTAFHRFAADNPAVILGPTWLDGFQAIIPLAEKKNILLVTPSAAHEVLTGENHSWPVTFYHNSTAEVTALLEILHTKGFKNVACIYEREPFAELLLKLMPPLSQEIGVNSGETGFQSIITQLKKSKPEVLLIFVWDERSLLTLLQQLRSQFADVPLATIHDGEGWLNNPSFKRVLPQLIYTKFEMADASFSSRFKNRFGYLPILTASNAYDAINSVLTAVSSGATDAKSIQQYLLTKTFNTVTFGEFRFNSDGSVPSKVAVKEHP